MLHENKDIWCFIKVLYFTNLLKMIHHYPPTNQVVD